MMASTFALIKDGVVVNVIVWDGESSADFGDGVVAFEYNENNPALIGYSFHDGKFNPPKLSPAEIKQQKNDAINSNVGTKEALMSYAKDQMVFSQTKLLMGRNLTENESALLNKWLDYMDVLEGIDANTPKDISWPAQPH